MVLKDILASLTHPSELSALISVKLGAVPGSRANRDYTGPLQKLAITLNDVDFCYAVLTKVSRSFAVVIQQLPSELRTAVCVFYLVLRGLDSVEDDMTFPVAEKLPLLRSFHAKLTEPGWCINDVGDTADYRVLLANFGKVIAVFRDLKPSYQRVIISITQQMGEGMAEFAGKLTEGVMYNVDSIAAYDQYCHYVAGLVGLGLCQLFGASGLEDASLSEERRLWNAMGMFLQKTNIIRDYVEDLEQARMWWPREIWSQFASSLNWFKENPDSDASLRCLNAMITDALALVPDVLQYLARLRNRQIFEFCAIPQVMAMATLAEIHCNANVFKRCVKIRRGLTARVLLSCSTKQQVNSWFQDFAQQMQTQVSTDSDVNAGRTSRLLSQVIKTTRTPATSVSNDSSNSSSGYAPLQSKSAYFSAQLALLLLGLCLIILYAKGQSIGSLPELSIKRTNSVELAALLGGSFSVCYLLNTMWTKF